MAYTSDIGESFRPVAHPWLVRGAYGVSWAYIAGDVAHEGYKAYLRNKRVREPPAGLAAMTAALPAGAESAVVQRRVTAGATDLSSKSAIVGAMGQVDLTSTKVAPLDDYRTVMAQRAIFQSVASMGLPAFTIHSIVKYSARAVKNVKNVRIRTYGPIGVSIILLLINLYYLCILTRIY